jgi:DNA topoisomerase-1
VDVNGSTVRFAFRGKAGVRHDIDVDDRRLARVVRRCQDLPGQVLFQYLDGGGERRTVGSADVNEYLRQISGEDFTAKDFRTWAGTVLAALALQEFGTFDSKAAAKRNIVRAIQRVAGRLGNTPAVCRKCYVHPEVINAYLDGTLLAELERGLKQAAKRPPRLSRDEAAVMALLQRRLAAERKARGAPKAR